MVTRKVILSGIGGSFVVSIPSKYCKAHKIKKGDVFLVDEDEHGRLVYSKIVYPPVANPVTLNIFGNDDDDDEDGDQ